MAEAQLAGRGQQQNGWHAQPGKNLTFSILLNPGFLPISQQFDLNRAISLGVHYALKPILGNALRVKWPNDIYYDDYKLGGILIENILSGEKIKHSVIGIGINVNQNEFPAYVPNATSVKQILQSDYDLRTLLSEICGCIEAYYLKLKAGRFNDIKADYLQILYGLNEWRNFKSNGEVFEGEITAVTPEGLLTVSTKAGNKTFGLKEIEFLK